MKPLEPGCIAMVINSKIGNNGKTVTIGNFLGSIKFHLGDDFWEISPGIRTDRGRISHVGHESQLMRIDDYNDVVKTEKTLELEGNE